jgi:hypothetical protein
MADPASHRHLTTSDGVIRPAVDLSTALGLPSSRTVARGNKHRK